MAVSVIRASLIQKGLLAMLTAASVILLQNAWWTDSVSPWHQHTFVRLLLALVLGVCVGAERQWRQRAAGLRTNTLVCLGAATFVDLGFTISPNTTQVIAYVVSGVGFLGAGAIMKEGANVRGLNTAATLWCSAAVGACVGAGENLDGIFVAVLLIVINSALRPLSRYIDQRSFAIMNPHALYRLRILCAFSHTDQTKRHLIRTAAENSMVLLEVRTENDEETEMSVLQAVLESRTRSDNGPEKVAAALRACPGVKSVGIATKEADTE